MAMIIANLGAGIILLILGLIIQTGKATYLIAGYNTASKEEQAKWDAAAMSKFIGWVILIVPSAVLLAACVPIALDIFPYVALILSWIAFVIILAGGVIYLNISPRFKRAE